MKYREPADQKLGRKAANQVPPIPKEKKDDKTNHCTTKFMKTVVRKNLQAGGKPACRTGIPTEKMEVFRNYFLGLIIQHINQRPLTLEDTELI